MQLLMDKINDGISDEMRGALLTFIVDLLQILVLCESFKAMYATGL